MNARHSHRRVITPHLPVNNVTNN